MKDKGVGNREPGAAGAEAGGRRKEDGGPKEAEGMATPLRVCPFCGAENVGCERLERASCWYVSCNVCGGGGGIAASKVSAVALWNCRAAGEKTAHCSTDMEVVFDERGPHIVFQGMQWFRDGAWRKTEDGSRKPECGGSETRKQIEAYLFGATCLNAESCARLAAGIAAIAEKHAERTEFAEIVARLMQRGVITREDADRLGDGAREGAKGAEGAGLVGRFVTAKLRGGSAIRQGLVICADPLILRGESGTLYECEGEPAVVVNPPDSLIAYSLKAFPREVPHA